MRIIRVQRMPLTYEQRVELLKKAREAKKNKKLANEPPSQPSPPSSPKPEPMPEPTPKKSRAKKPTLKTLDLKPPEPMPEFVDSEPEVIEEIVYKPKDKKKKKIIKKIIMEESSDDEEVEVIEERIKAPKKKKEPKEKAPESVPETPKVPSYVCPTKTSFFNF